MWRWKLLFPKRASEYTVPSLDLLEIELVTDTAATLWNIYAWYPDWLPPVLLLFRVISCEEGKALAESWNAAFMESSAKENQVRRKMTGIVLEAPV